MQNINDILYYNEDFIERITSELFSIHALWSIRPLDNLRKELISGTANEIEKFSNFIYKHIEREYPFALHIYIGNAEKNYPSIMLHKNRISVKVKFDQLFPNYIGTPLILPNYPPRNQ